MAVTYSFMPWVAQMEEGEMSEVTQTILLGDPSGRPGNCLQAAVASLLGLDLDAVPHFVESTGDWFEDMAVFVLGHGYELMQHSPAHDPPVFGLAFGFTNRSADRHAVVYRDGVMAWDPHPSRDGLTSVKVYLDFDPIAVPREEVPA